MKLAHTYIESQEAQIHRGIETRPQERTSHFKKMAIPDSLCARKSFSNIEVLGFN
jgi:hypothetical protein